MYWFPSPDYENGASDGVYALRYTDDVAWRGTDEDKEWFGTKLSQRFEFKYEKCWKSYAGMSVDQDVSRGTVEFKQKALRSWVRPVGVCVVRQ